MLIKYIKYSYGIRDWAPNPNAFITVFQKIETLPFFKKSGGAQLNSNKLIIYIVIIILLLY